MNDELHPHLDGEQPDDSLAGTDAGGTDEWDRMVASFRKAAPSGGAPPWLEQRVMAEIQSLPTPGIVGRWLGWLLNPTPIRVSPLATGLVAAAFAAVILLPGTEVAPPISETPTPATPGEAIVYVQFLLEAPAATSVAVAGDFSEWEPQFSLADADGDGVWTGRVPLRPGVHGYMFLIDGEEWATDPRADRYQDDGFGNRNAVLAVSAGA
jgi:hypothetical protein